MKITRLNLKTRYFLPVLLLICCMLAFTSCARKIAFESSPVVPAANGSVKIKKDKNNNYAISISIRNLAESRRLVPPRDTYVVWIETDGNGIKNIGQMNSSSGLFSSTLKASLEAVSSFKPRRVFITAEDNAEIQYPGLTEVMRTRLF